MAELRAQTAELTAKKAACAGRASCARRATWHVLCNVMYICNMPRVMERAPVICRSAHQHLPCRTTAAMPASTARTGRESATCTCHAAMRWEPTSTMSVPRVPRRCAASLGALSAQYSNLAAAADSKPKAAHCGASDASLRDGSGSQCTLMRTRAHACAFLAHTCECGV